MVSFKGKVKDIVRTIEDELIFTITTKDSNMPEDELTDYIKSQKDCKIDICKWFNKRSLNANNYCWVLLDEISKKQRITKEEVYRLIIQRVGVFEILPIKKVALDNFIKKWESKGLGWICEVQRDSKIPQYTNVVVYFGTSSYNSEEMARFIDEVVYIAKENGIQTKTPNEIAEMKSLWSTINEV